MKCRAVVLTIPIVALWAAPGAAARKALHTRFLFQLSGGNSTHWTETTPATTDLGSVGGWSCTAGTIELFQGLASSDIYKTAEIKCVDTNGSAVTVSAMCNVALEERESRDAKLQMKNARDVNVEISCYTRRE
jgi:hypothetical protein